MHAFPSCMHMGYICRFLFFIFASQFHNVIFLVLVLYSILSLLFRNKTLTINLPIVFLGKPSVVGLNTNKTPIPAAHHLAPRLSYLTKQATTKSQKKSTQWEDKPSRETKWTLFIELSLPSSHSTPPKPFFVLRLQPACCANAQMISPPCVCPTKNNFYAIRSSLFYSFTRTFHVFPSK